MSRRAIVTGMGVLAPTGASVDEHWTSTVEGRCAIGPVSRFDASGYRSTLAAEIPDFHPEEHLPGRLLPQTDHMTRLALVTAQSALLDARVDLAALPEFGAGVVTASSAGGFAFGQHELNKLCSQGPEHVSAYQSFAWFYAVNTGQISIRHGLRGPSGVLVTEQAGGLDAVAQGCRYIRDELPMAMAGGVDGSPCPWGWVAQQAGGRLSTSVDPAQAYLPFAAGAGGHVPGEGGALLILEPGGSAAPRRRQEYGSIAGYAATFDPPAASGRPSTLRRAVELALRDAAVRPDQVDVVFADAAGTPELDAAEAAALREVFGPRGVPVTAPKSMFGRLGAGGAALDVATALLAIRRGIVPPTVNVDEPAPGYELDLVLAPREAPVRTALVIARGVGGFNAAMIVAGDN